MSAAPRGMRGRAADSANGAKPPRPGAPRVAIVLVNWNGLEDTRACLASLRVLEGPAWTAIVVDNGSRGPDAATLAAEFPAAVVLPQAENLGFAGGCNVGIRHAIEAGFSHVILLNNDAIVRDPALLRRLVAAVEGGATAACPKVVWEGTGRVWFGGGRVRLWAGTVRHLGWKRPADQLHGLRPTDYVTGCALFAPTAAFREHGLLDDSYFLYFEETDWCMRVRAAGGTLVADLDAVVAHQVSSSARSVPVAQAYYMARGRMLFFRRWSGAAFWGLPLLAGAAWVLRTALPQAARGHLRAARATLAGAWAGLRGVRGRTFVP